MEQAMFVKSVIASMFAVIFVSSSASVEHGPLVPAEPIWKVCEGRDGWSDPAPPAHISGNVYMVGTCGIAVLLITTPKGHFLIDGATDEAAEGIVENIRKLGFDPRDVRYLLSTHEHIDHVGGLAKLKRITGAKYVSRKAAKVAMESGKPDPQDPQFGSIPSFEGVKVDRLLKDGQRLRIGDQTLTMIATPGHSPGGTSWTWKTCRLGNCVRFVYADSLNAVGPDSYRFSDHPAAVATLRTSMKHIGEIDECNILISPHPGQSRLFERLSGKDELFDRSGCLTFSQAARDRLNARLAKEAAQ
jgi:metallo-beta-lactamase class B